MIDLAELMTMSERLAELRHEAWTRKDYGLYDRLERPVAELGKLITWVNQRNANERRRS